MDKKIKIIVIHAEDNVGIALSQTLEKGEQVHAKELAVTALDPIPIGHKIAVKDIPAGGDVIKFGEMIGRAKKDIKKGEHVHVHNVEDITEQVSQQSRKGR